MRYFRLSIIALCALLLSISTSCTRDVLDSENESYGNLIVRSFEAGIPEEDDTKTYISESGGKFTLKWGSKDQIRIIGQNTNTLVNLTVDKKNTKKATFQAKVAEGDALYAFYPATMAAALSSGNPQITVPASQDGSDKLASIIVAKDIRGSFNFRNVTSLLYIKFNKNLYPTAEKIRIESLDNSSILAGIANVRFDANGFVQSVSPVGSMSKTVTVDIAGRSMGNGVYAFYATVLPQHFSKGLKMSILDQRGSVIRTVTCAKPIDARSNTLVNFDNITEHLDDHVFFETETFSNCRGNGLLLSDGSKCDRYGWEFYNCYESLGSVRIGDNSTKGYAITPPLGIESGDATVTFNVIKSSQSLVSRLFVVGNGAVSSQSVTAGNGKWEKRTYYITGADTETRLRFETDADWDGMSLNNAYCIDDVRVIDGASEFDFLNLVEGFSEIVEGDADSLMIPLRTSGVPQVGTPAATASNIISFTSPVFYSTQNQCIESHFTPNPTKDLRTSAISIDLLRVASLRFTLIQRGLTTIKFADDQLSFTKDGGTKSTTYEMWNFGELESPEFCSVTGGFSASLEGNELKVSIDTNRTIEPRSGEVVVYGKSVCADGIEREKYVSVKLFQEHGIVAQSIAFDSDSLVVMDLDKYTEPVLDRSGVKTEVVFTSSDETVAGIDVKTGKLALTGKAGISVITATAVSSEYYYEASASYTVRVKHTQTPGFSSDSLNVIVTVGADGEVLAAEFVEPVLSGAATAVTYTIEGDPVATVDPLTGKLTVTGKEGVARVSVNLAADDNHYAASASYVLKCVVVKAPEPAPEPEPEPEPEPAE